MASCPICDRQTPDVLCSACVHRTKKAAEDIPVLAAELETTISRQSVGGSSGKRKKGDDQPLPLNLAAVDKQRECVTLLVEWADHIAADAKIPTLALRPTPVQHRRRAADAAKIIIDNLSWFRVNPDAPDAANAIRIVRNWLRAASDRPPERVWAGPCHAKIPVQVTHEGDTVRIALSPSKCDLDLYREWGKDEIICDGHRDPAKSTGCHAVHTTASRRDFLINSIEDELLPLRLVWESLYHLLPEHPVPWDTASKWRRKQRTTPPRLNIRGTSRTGVELFRGGDIIDLAREESPHDPRRRNRTRRRVTV